MTDSQKAKAVAEYLDRNRSEFRRDPSNDGFYVHERVFDAVKRATRRSPFRFFSEGEFETHAALMAVGGQLDFFPWNIPGIEQFVMVKGDGICLVAADNRTGPAVVRKVNKKRRRAGKSLRYGCARLQNGCAQPAKTTAVAARIYEPDA